LALTKIVKFPEFAIEFKISQVAFRLFNIDIHYYALLIVIGIIVAIILCKISKENFYIKFDSVIEAIILGLIAGVIGARAYFVFFNFQYYARKRYIANI